MTVHSFRIFFLCLILSLSLAIAVAAEGNHQEAAENDNTKKCYPTIGCFSLKRPWNGLWRRNAPRSPSDLRIEFILITRHTPPDKPVRDYKVDVTDVYEPTRDSLTALDYSAARPYTVFHIWGCVGSIAETAKLSRKVTEPYLKKIDINLIFVLWDANILKYRQCVSDTRTVAAVTSVFIEAMIRSQDLTTDKIHMIGESIGAHIVGYVGKRIRNIYRITGLDPAQPAFEGYDPEVRLDSSDAQLVDVLHTNAVPFRGYRGFGFVNPIGDVDFYFNNGIHQPGCRTSLLDLCSHVRVNKYWLEALKNECVMWGVKKPEDITVRKFLRDATESETLHDATKCESEATKDNYCTSLGWDTFARDARGVFHIKTNRKSPFCQNGI